MNTHNIVLRLSLFYFFLRSKCVVDGIGLTSPQLVAIFPLIICLVYAKLDVSNKSVDSSINLKMNVKQFKETAPQLLCNDEKEAEEVAAIIKEATGVLKDLATTEEGYTLYSSSKSEYSLYFKRVHGDDVGKYQFQIPYPEKFEKLIDRIWDANGSKLIDPNFMEGKIIRVYDENTVLVHQCYKGSFGVEGRYFYVLANKNKVDDNTYVIMCVSVNVNDNHSEEEPITTRFTSLKNNSGTCAGSGKNDHLFLNPFVKKANTILIHVNPNECGLNTSAKKMFINLSGYVIRKDNSNIDVTYISSVQLGLSAIIPTFILKKIKASKMMLLQALKKDL